jgi:hypothetical protein
VPVALAAKNGALAAKNGATDVGDAELLKK